MKTKRTLFTLIIAALLVSTWASVAAAASAPSSLAGYSFHTVQPGENLYRISLRYGVSMYAIMQANGLLNANYVYVGQVLRIPTGPVAPPPVPPPAPPPANGFYYTVQYADTLAVIAARYGTTVYAIMQANGLVNMNLIYPGQVLWIPGKYVPPQPSGGNWYAEYYNNEKLAGAPSFVRYDAAINFDWGLGWPNPKISADNFSVRWTRTLWLNTGTYRFTVTVDDGARLYVDGVLVIDQWKEQPAATFTADVPLGAGYHKIVMEYFELTGVARACLTWDKISDTGPGGPCGTCPPGTTTTTSAWFGQYYDNQYLKGDPTFTRTDANVDFDWGKASPGDGIDINFWSARWTQKATFQSGKYRFHAIADDGVRIFVGGGVVMDGWEDNIGYEHLSDKVMQAGTYEVRVEYFELGHDAKIKVWWEKLN